MLRELFEAQSIVMTLGSPPFSEMSFFRDREQQLSRIFHLFEYGYNLDYAMAGLLRCPFDSEDKL